MTHPNFIIVGAMKAGTSSLALTLRLHPDIFLPQREVHFFDSQHRYPLGMNHYATFFAGADGQTAIGEKTPTYSMGELVPTRIREALPDVKLIWVFREPLARAYSHYWFFVSKGLEPLSFADALDREAAGKTDDKTMRYRERSVYANQVERYLQDFPREQMHFLLFEDFVRDHHAVLRQTCTFLGVDPAYAFPDHPERENTTKMPRSRSVQFAAHRLFSRRGTRLLRWITHVNRRLGADRYPPVPPDLRAELSAYFAPHNARLAALTGLDLTSWASNMEKVNSASSVSTT